MGSIGGVLVLVRVGLWMNRVGQSGGHMRLWAVRVDACVQAGGGEERETRGSAAAVRHAGACREWEAGRCGGVLCGARLGEHTDC